MCEFLSRALLWRRASNNASGRANYAAGVVSDNCVGGGPINAGVTRLSAITGVTHAAVLLPITRLKGVGTLGRGGYEGIILRARVLPSTHAGVYRGQPGH